MPEFYADLSLGIIIGGSCPKALEPLEVIPCIENGPYAYRTRLGWCTVGPLNSKMNGEDSESCHRIRTSQLATKVPAKDVISGNISGHYFAQPTSV